MGKGILCAQFLVPVIFFIIYTTCAILVLFRIDASFEIFYMMGALGNEYSRTLLWYLALCIFSIIWFIDAIMLAYIWSGKMLIAEEGCDNGCTSTFCGPIVGTIWLFLFWCAFIVLLVLMLAVPVLGAILVAARFLCSTGDEGVHLLIMITQTLPGLDLTAANRSLFPVLNITGTPPSAPPPMMPPPSPPPYDVSPPSPPPSPPRQPFYPPYCMAAVVAEAYTSGMLLSCTPLIVLSQAVIIASACTVIYGTAIKGGGIARTGDVTLNKLR